MSSEWNEERERGREGNTCAHTHSSFRPSVGHAHREYIHARTPAREEQRPRSRRQRGRPTLRAAPRRAASSEFSPSSSPPSFPSLFALSSSSSSASAAALPSVLFVFHLFVRSFVRSLLCCHPVAVVGGVEPPVPAGRGRSVRPARLRSRFSTFPPGMPLLWALALGNGDGVAGKLNSFSGNNVKYSDVFIYSPSPIFYVSSICQEVNDVRVLLRIIIAS